MTAEEEVQTTKEQVSSDDLDALRFIVAEFEKAELTAQAAKYSVQVFHRHLALKYGLTDGDQINLNGDGEITRCSK